MNVRRAAILVATLLIVPLVAPSGSAYATVSPTLEATGEWTGPDPRLGPGPGSVPGQTYPDDLLWIDDSQPDDISVGTDGAGPCKDKAKGHKVKTHKYVQTEGKVPLRCGRYSAGSGWGWRKLKAKDRWNVWWDGMIGATMQSPLSFVEQQGTAKVFKTEWFEECDPVYRFVVVVETSRRGNGKMGIITAYQQWQ